MIAPPDAVAVRAFFARVARRAALIASAEGAAGGLFAAFLVTLGGILTHRVTSVGLAIGVGVVIVVFSAVLRVGEQRTRGRRVASLVEEREPRCRNLLITADELMPRDGRALAIAGGNAEYIGALVFREAARLVGTLDPRALFPARAALTALAATAALWLATLSLVGTASGARATSRLSSSPNAAVTIGSVDVVVTPPAYVGQPATTTHDPSRIQALAGSAIKLVVHSRAVSVGVETLHRRVSLAATSSDVFSGNLVADADGYIAIEPVAANGAAGVRRLVGLSVIPDVAPRARITAPGKDLFLRDPRASIDVAIEANDDIGLASLKLRYTKVSGSGERFTFVEGDVPIAITPSDARTWTARAHWPLESLGLTAGDMVVYRAVVTDRRPGAAPSESDSFIAEILAPGGNAAPGFALDPDQERYAVSQQMVILKTERLVAQRPSLSAGAYATASQEIAAEQRKVRAEFVFMMGGELAEAPDPDANISDLNEEQEVQGEDDLAAGRMVNQGRIALLRAIRSMSRAATSLTTADLPPALTHERAALAQLERAFSRSRILLRALTERERLDLSRRLTGSLADAARDVRPNAVPEANARVVELRRALAGVADLTGQRAFSSGAAMTASSLAANLLRIDASSAAIQGVAAQLSSAATALEQRRSDEARVNLDRATSSLAALLRRELVDAPSNATSLESSRLGGALTDALERRR